MRKLTMPRLTAIALGAIAAAALATAAGAETPRERGAYLVRTIAGCGNCHTPKDAAGNAIAGQELAGGLVLEIPELGHVIVPNITPDKNTGIGKWSEAQIALAVREGKRPDGTIIGPPMPIGFYRGLSDADVAAIAAYVHGVRPINHAVARSQYKIALPPAYGPPVGHVAAPPRTDKVAYGGYLAGPVGHCMDCHTPHFTDGRPDMSRLGGGGFELPVFGKPGEAIVSRNLTPDPEHGLGKWSDADIKHAIVTGVRPDGTKLVRTMAFDWYAKMAPQDLDAIVAYLRSLKPVK